MRPLWRFLIGQAVVLVLVTSLPWVALSAYPGAIEHTAPILCPAGQPDARAVEYDTDLGADGTGTSWTLICMGPDGDVTEVGSWAPLAVIFGAILLAVEALVLPLQILGIVRRRRGKRHPHRVAEGARRERRIQVGFGING